MFLCLACEEHRQGSCPGDQDRGTEGRAQHRRGSHRTRRNRTHQVVVTIMDANFIS